MGKVKNLEKKDKSAAEFDKNNPAKRVKSLNDKKLNKKGKNKKAEVLGGAAEVEIKPLVKEAKKEIAKALKAKENLKKPKEEAKPKEAGAVVEIPENLVTRDVIKKAVKACKDGVEKEKEAATAKNLFDEESRIGLQVVFSKVPKTPPHAKKILLENSIFGDDQPDICFIIRDGKGNKAELIVDETVVKFEEMLKASGVTGIKTILPMSKLKKDYGPNNMKLKLLNTYDLFLVEPEIAEHTYSILGKHFIQKRKRPLQIDINKKETLKFSIDNAIKKVSFKINANSNFSIFEVGTLKMENAKIVANIVTAVEQLKEKWPGGWLNIMRLYLKPMRQSKVSIPLYYSKINPNDVEIPVEVGVKQTRLDKITELLAKKSKKLRLDRKTKKIVKVKGQAPLKKLDKAEKDKKRKLAKEEVTSEIKSEIKSEETAETKPKKKKKSSESEVASAEIAPEDKTAKTKKKKKGAVVEVAAEAPQETEEVAVAPKKKKTKKNKA